LEIVMRLNKLTLAAAFLAATTAAAFAAQPSTSSSNISTSADTSASAPAATPTPAATPAPVAAPQNTGTAQDPNVNGNSKSADAPLFFKLGSAKITPGGYVDLTTIYRTTDSGNGLTTSDATIPLNNTQAGGLSETRLTAQGTRFSLRIDENVGKTAVVAYGEADFNGYQPYNLEISNNPDTFRLRHFFVQLRRDKWDFLAGQDWTFLTTNRVGLSPLPSDIYTTVNPDLNYQVGITYARQAQFRAVYHFNDHFAIGASVENPQQFVGSAPTFPTLFATSYLNEVDNNTDFLSTDGATKTPNFLPDFVVKIAYDTKIGDKAFHVEAAGLSTTPRIDTLTAITTLGHTVVDKRTAGGVSFGTNLEVVKNFHIITTSFWSDGGGRYLGALAPAFIIKQIGTANAPFTIGLIHSGGGTAGFEWQANKAAAFQVLYGGAYIGRNFAPDGGAAGHPLVGYGYRGSAATNNESIQQGTITGTFTLWKSPKIGALNLISQNSYLERKPWSVATGQPKNAHQFFSYFAIRYIFP
jgi:hypothetical protein